MVEAAVDVINRVLEAEYGGYQWPVSERIQRALALAGLLADSEYEGDPDAE